MRWPNRLTELRQYVYKSFSDFDLTWCVGRPRPDMRTSVTSTRSKVKVKVKVTELVSYENCTFLGLSAPIFTWSSKLMVGGDIVWDLIYSLSESDFRISF